MLRVLRVELVVDIGASQLQLPSAQDDAARKGNPLTLHRYAKVGSGETELIVTDGRGSTRLIIFALLLLRYCLEFALDTSAQST